MKLAQWEAQRHGQSFVGTEHLLLALVAEGEGRARRLLIQRGVDVEALRKRIDRLLSTPQEELVLGKLPISPALAKVVDFAIEEAQQGDSSVVGTEHLLMGLMREGEHLASDAVMEAGTGLQELRDAAVRQTKG